MTEQFANNASSTLNGSITNVASTLIVTSAATFPTQGEFRLLIGISPLTAEIVLVTNVSGTTFTITRAQEGTSASAWPDQTPVTHILTAGAVDTLRVNLRKSKPLDVSLDTIGAPQDGYALSWVNSDGYWAARPGSPFVVVGNELYTTRTLSIDGYGTVASAHGDGYKLFVNGPILAAKYSAGEIPASVAKFGYVSNALQSFVVPERVTSIKVKMWGPGGGTGNYSASGGGGAGGYTTGYLSVTPGETLYLAIGSGGKHPIATNGNGGLGGWPGGGFGTRGDASGGGGGGFTGIFNTSMLQANALMIAAGGGGSSGFGNFGAGGGGGLIGGSGSGTSGKGATQSAGGLNGNGTSSPSYTAGSALAGGTAFTDNTTSVAVDNGGGGSGYWGGGAGQGDARAGGGGSGFIHATRVTSGVTTAGNNAASGAGTTSPPGIADPDYISGIGVGAAATGAAGTDGGDGYLIFQWGGITSFDNDSLDFGNNASISTLNSDMTIDSPAKITIQSATDLLLSSSTVTTINSTTTTTLSGTQDVRINTAGTLRGYFDSNGIFRFGPTASSTLTAFGLTYPISSSDIGYGYGSSSIWFNMFSSAAGARSAVSAYNTSVGASATTGISIQAPGSSHPTGGYSSNGIIEHAGAANSALVLSSMLGDGTATQIKGRIYRSGVWSIGDAINNDTSAEAQAGLTGALINLSSGSGTFTTATNQALLFNQSGALNLQGNTEVRFNTSSSLRGYFDSSGVFRTGPSAATSASGFGISWPASGVDTVFVHNASGNSYYTNWSGLASGAAGFLAYNTSAGASATIGMSVGGAGLSHGTTALAGNGFMEQAGSATSALVFRKVLGNATSPGTTGRIYQSGAWVLGEDTINDTSAEAQAGLTGTLLNISQTTGGTLTTVSNQALAYNVAGTITLQGNAGHNFITGTTSVASTNTNKFITSLGIRSGISNVGTNLTIPDGYHNIFVVTLSSSITITLPSAPFTGDTYLIKDRDGSATAFNIVIAGNGKNIEQFTGAAASSLTLNQNYDSVTIIYNGTFWSII